MVTSSFAASQTDTDWNWSGKRDCKHPKKDSAQWMEEGDRRFVRFQLRDGDIGGCRTDNDKKHSAKFGKPFSERAEWAGRVFKNTGKTYHISFDVRFVQGFDDNGMSETFFQIKDCPTSRIPLMAKLGGYQKKQGGSARFGFNLATQTSNSIWSTYPMFDDPVDNEWHRMDAYFKTGRSHSLEIKLDDEVILPKTEFKNVFDCGRPTLRIGIYRSGSRLGNNSHSIVDYDRIQIEEVNE